MTHLISTKTRFVTMTSVAALMVLGLSGTSAQAACPKVGTIVTCNGMTVRYSDAAANITVNVETMATVSSGTGSAVFLSGAGVVINNYGAIDAATGISGAVVRQGGVIANFKGASIKGGTESAVFVQGGPANIQNAG